MTILSYLFYFQKYDVFQDIKALLVLIPALLGLKGNLDMCLASRLSTQANLGNMSSYRELLKMIIGNLLLVQVSYFEKFYYLYVIYACFIHYIVILGSKMKMKPLYFGSVTNFYEIMSILISKETPPYQMIYLQPLIQGGVPPKILNGMRGRHQV